MTTARELHDSYAKKGIMLWMGDPSAQQIILRALDLLARVQESEDELVRRLRAKAIQTASTRHPPWDGYELAASLVALNAERDICLETLEKCSKIANKQPGESADEAVERIKAHAEAMAATLGTWAEIDQCKCHALDAYRRDFPKDAP